MNPKQVKSSEDLRRALVADRPSLQYHEVTAAFHFCEEQYLMLSHPLKHLMIEFKLDTPIALSAVSNVVDLAKSEIFRRYNVRLYIRQVAFNRTNIITMYTMIKRSPKPKRKQLALSTSTSGVSSDSESVTSSDRNGKRDLPPPIAFIASSLPRHAGEIEPAQFNGTTHPTPILRTSTAQQTDLPVQCHQPEIKEAQEKPLEPKSPSDTYAAIEFNKNELQVQTTSTFTKVRRYLAYFINNQEAVLEGESYLDLKVRINNDGLIGDDSEIKRAYYTALQQKGFTEHQITTDLRTLGNNLQAKKVRDINASRMAFDQYYTGRVKLKVQPPIPPPPGRFDPELCTIA